MPMTPVSGLSGRSQKQSRLSILRTHLVTKFEFNEDQKELLKEWVRRLRSGEYKQGQSYLVTLRKNKKSTYCCLGVLTEMAYEKGIVAKRVKVLEPGLSVINYSNN